MSIPKPGLVYHGREFLFRSSDGTIEAFQKPNQPGGDIEIALLSVLQEIVVPPALLADLGRHAVKPHLTLLGSSERQFSDGAGDTSVAVFERMNRHEPQVCHRCGE